MVKKILCIDDAYVVRMAVKKEIERTPGYEAVLADSAGAALVALQEHEISLILCDQNMPEMTGLEFVEKIKGMGAYMAVPVVMLTTEASVAMKERGKSIGIQGWIVKPLKAGAVKIACDRLIP